MLGIIGTLGSAVVSGVSDYFKTKQEIKKVKVEADKEIIVATAKAKIKQLEKESTQDHDINMLMVKNMNKSWKDEFVLIIVSIPAIMLFVPSVQEYAIQGFNSLGDAPLWYQILLLGIFFTIYGLKDVFKLVIQLLVNKFKGK
jgi:hypothetical protein